MSRAPTAAPSPREGPAGATRSRVVANDSTQSPVAAANDETLVYIKGIPEKSLNFAYPASGSADTDDVKQREGVDGNFSVDRNFSSARILLGVSAIVKRA